MPPVADRPRLWPSIATLVVGATCAVLGLALFFVVVLSGILNTAVYDTPVHISLQCHAGNYLVYQYAGTNDSGVPFGVGQSGPLTITPREVRVTGPGGTECRRGRAPAPKRSPRARRRTQCGGLQCAGGGDLCGRRAEHGPDVGDHRSVPREPVRPGAPWLLLSGTGAIIAVVGLVLLIVKANRRTRAPAPGGRSRCAVDLRDLKPGRSAHGDDE